MGNQITNQQTSDPQANQPLTIKFSEQKVCNQCAYLLELESEETNRECKKCGKSYHVCERCAFQNDDGECPQKYMDGCRNK